MSAQLGERYVDRVSGFEGVAIGRAEYLAGNVQVQLEARHPTEAKVRWIDECRLDRAEDTPTPTQYV